MPCLAFQSLHDAFGAQITRGLPPDLACALHQSLRSKIRFQDLLGRQPVGSQQIELIRCIGQFNPVGLAAAAMILCVSK